jgi:hypothetical protein
VEWPSESCSCPPPAHPPSKDCVMSFPQQHHASGIGGGNGNDHPNHLSRPFGLSASSDEQEANRGLRDDGENCEAVLLSNKRSKARSVVVLLSFGLPSPPAQYKQTAERLVRWRWGGRKRAGQMASRVVTSQDENLFQRSRALPRDLSHLPI